jgi:hypothetical protein
MIKLRPPAPAVIKLGQKPSTVVVPRKLGRPNVKKTDQELQVLPRASMDIIVHVKTVLNRALANYPDAVRAVSFLDELILEANAIREGQNYLCEKDGYRSALHGRVIVIDGETINYKIPR